MVGVLINPKTEVLRLSSTRFRRLPLWVSCYELSIEICRITENHENQESEVLKQLARTALNIPTGFARSASFRLGRNYIRSLRRTFVDTRELAMMLLLCYELEYVSSEKFADLNSKLTIFAKKLGRHIRKTQRRYRRKKLLGAS